MSRHTELKQEGRFGFFFDYFIKTKTIVAIERHCTSVCVSLLAVVALVPYSSPQSRQSAKLFIQSSELGLPQPLTRRRVCPLPPVLGGEGHTRLRERCWGSPNSDEGTYTVVLFIYMYIVQLTLCSFPSLLLGVMLVWISVW
jgi:hypothetical protein